MNSLFVCYQRKTHAFDWTGMMAVLSGLNGVDGNGAKQQRREEKNNELQRNERNFLIIEGRLRRRKYTKT